MSDPAAPRRDIILPDLGLGDQQVRASVWLVDQGDEVVEGDRLLEVVASNVTIDIPAPATGVLEEHRVSEGDPLIPGQVLGVIAEEARE